MFSVAQKRHISSEVQRILRETNHPELPEGEIRFTLHVAGAEAWSWADIQNNESVIAPQINPHNEAQDPNTGLKENSNANNSKASGTTPETPGQQ